jgi:hypothetical protein
VRRKLSNIAKYLAVGLQVTSTTTFRDLMLSLSRFNEVQAPRGERSQKTLRDGLVRVFEGNIIDEKSKRVYSPLHEWHRSAKESHNNKGKITKWVYAYCAVRLV